LLPAGRAASAGAGPSGGAGSIAALLGLEHEAAALVEVDASGGRGAVGVLEGDGALEDIGVLGGFGLGWVGPRQVEPIAEFGEEKLAVGAFTCAGMFPALDEGVDQGRYAFGFDNAEL